MAEAPGFHGWLKGQHGLGAVLLPLIILIVLAAIVASRRSQSPPQVLDDWTPPEHAYNPGAGKAQPSQDPGAGDTNKLVSPDSQVPADTQPTATDSPKSIATPPSPGQDPPRPVGSDHRPTPEEMGHEAPLDKPHPEQPPNRPPPGEDVPDH